MPVGPPLERAPVAIASMVNLAFLAGLRHVDGRHQHQLSIHLLLAVFHETTPTLSRLALARGAAPPRRSREAYRAWWEQTEGAGQTECLNSGREPTVE